MVFCESVKEGVPGYCGETMLLRRHVYSSWYFRHTVAIEVAFSFPKCSASCLAIETVDRRVPYKSNATTMLFLEDMLDVDPKT